MLIVAVAYTRSMSFQAYLDNIEQKTGLTPQEFITIAKQKGFDQPGVKTKQIIEWLKEDYQLGHGHALALVHIIKYGPEISDKHVGTDGPHRDAAQTLRIDGIAKRAQSQ